MFKNIKISGVSTKLASVAKFARSKTAVAAAVAATSLALTTSTLGAISDITGFSSSTTTGVSTTITNVTGYGASYSPFKGTNTYTMHYLGQDQAITSVTAGGLGTYNASGLGTVTIRTGNTGADNTTIWYQGSGTGANHSTVTLDGPLMTNYASAFNSNNLLMGADNIFSNMGNAVGNNTNVNRIDVTYAGFKATSKTAFSIFDRGAVNDHDAFKIAAITSVDASGNPTSYGPLFSFADGTWGLSSLVVSTQEDIARKNNTMLSDTLHPSDSTAQSIGGVLIQSSSLVPGSTTIYGYSLFSAAVPSNASSSTLVSWSNLPAADSTTTGGGLDPVATLGVIYTSAVPEPTTAGLAALAIGGFIARRPGRKNAQ